MEPAFGLKHVCWHVNCKSSWADRRVTFLYVVELPFYFIHVDQKAMNEESKHLSYNRARTVLVIGDSLGVLKKVAFALQYRGHTVIWGESGRTGLRIAESDMPDLIISEINLSDMSGIQVCRTVKSSFLSDIPVVLVGTLGDEAQDERRAQRVGADAYFVSFANRRGVLAKLEWLMRRGITSAANRWSQAICETARRPAAEQHFHRVELSEVIFE